MGYLGERATCENENENLSMVTEFVTQRNNDGVIAEMRDTAFEGG